MPRVETLQLTNDGPEYVEPDRIVLPVVTAPWHHVSYLQLADRVVSASCAAIAERPAGLDLQSSLGAPELVDAAVVEEACFGREESDEQRAEHTGAQGGALAIRACRALADVETPPAS